jgi:hypothetical protein
MTIRLHDLRSMELRSGASAERDRVLSQLEIPTTRPRPRLWLTRRVCLNIVATAL